MVRTIRSLSTTEIKMRATAAEFHLSGVAAALTHPDASRYQAWVDGGNAGEMSYLTDYRTDRRVHPTELLPSARSIICLGILYNGPEPRSTEFYEPGRAWISRYAWGSD